MNASLKRNELKYYINYLEYHLLVDRLKHMMQVDSHSEPHKGYFIRSLYFDSWNDECYFQKQSGVSYRKKYRLRLYDTTSDSIKIEIKHKMGDGVLKETAWIHRETAEAMICGQYEKLLDYQNPLLDKIYGIFTVNCYTPKVVVDYHRDAFFWDLFNIRVTFDKYVSTNNTHFDLFSPHLHMLSAIPDNRLIMEIKFDQHFPDSLKYALQIDGFNRLAISKYTLSRRFLKFNNWEDN